MSGVFVFYPCFIIKNHKVTKPAFNALALTILSGNEIQNVLTSIKGHSSITNSRNPNLDLININAYTEFGLILSSCSKDIERKQILTSIKGHDSVTNLSKTTGNNPKMDVVNIKCIYRIWSLCPVVPNLLSGKEIMT